MAWTEEDVEVPLPLENRRDWEGGGRILADEEDLEEECRLVEFAGWMHRVAACVKLEMLPCSGSTMIMSSSSPSANTSIAIVFPLILLLSVQLLPISGKWWTGGMLSRFEKESRRSTGGIASLVKLRTAVVGEGEPVDELRV